MGSKRKPTFENEATERRRRIAFALLDTLTKTDSELQPDDVSHFRLVAYWFGGKELVDRILAASKRKKSSKNRGISAEYNQLQEEILIATIITCLDRLLTDPPPAKKRTPVKTLKLASGRAIAVGSVVPKH